MTIIAYFIQLFFQSFFCYNINMEHNLNFFLSLLSRFNWLGNWLFLFISLAECIPFIGAVFPGGTLIYLAGIFAAQGYFKVTDVIIFATLGAIIGDYSGYALGRWGGKWLSDKNIIKAKYMDKGHDFFDKYGAKSVFWGRFIGATRAFVPFTAGTAKMKNGTFFLWNIAGAIFWAIVHVMLGYFSGNIITEIIRRWSRRLSLVIYLLLIGAAVYFIFTWIIKKRNVHPITGFKQKTEIISNLVLEEKWFKKVDDKYPVAEEFLINSKVRNALFTWILAFIVLALMYFLILVLDLF